MNKLLVITGASRGIGKATAKVFLKAGWRVLNIARRSCDLKEVLNLNVDLANPQWSLLSQAELLSTFGKPMQICLVHNSANYQKDQVAHLDPSIFRSILEVNLVAPMILNRLIIPYMATGSAIIYMGSTLSEKAIANNASYVISKHASVGMMRATTQDLAKQQIHSCCICPGFTETEMLAKHTQNDPKIVESLNARVGANRLIQPSEIANLVLFAANNPVLNGAVLHANLGQIEN